MYSWVWSCFFADWSQQLVCFSIMESWALECFIWSIFWPSNATRSACSSRSNSFVKDLTETPLEVCSGWRNLLLVSSNIAHQNFKIGCTWVIGSVDSSSRVWYGIFSWMSFDQGFLQPLLRWWVNQFKPFLSKFAGSKTPGDKAHLYSGSVRSWLLVMVMLYWWQTQSYSQQSV